ncbi:MAG TPA: SusC/RagA family TonB-linked outer membrane protein [Gemmatimonadales bacterium]
MRPFRVRAPVVALAASLLLLTSAATLAAQTTGVITGKVAAKDGLRPLGSAQVAVVGTSIRTQTNDVGEYVLAGVPEGPQQVRVQLVGFSPMTQAVTVAAGETATLNFDLREAPITLEEVVVTATGEMRRREISNALSTISSASIETAPIQNAQQALQRSMPGVTILANSGQLGAGGTIRLRGVNSVSQGNNPIIYVDGVRLYSGSTPIAGNARQRTNPFNDINAEDIERIEIVKGAAATTLYGTEASGGVIQIFTKRGSSGAPQWSLEVTGGTNDLNGIGPDGDPTGLFVKQCRGPELYGLDIVTTSATFGEDVVFEDPTCPSNGTWLRTGMIQRYSGSVRGGGENLLYSLSGNFTDEDGAIPSSHLRDGGFRGSFSFNPSSEIHLALTTAFTKRDLQWVPDGNLANGFLLNVGRGPAGNFKGGGCSATADVCVTNGEIFKLDAFTRGDHFVTGFTVNYAPVARFTNRLTVGYDYNNAENQSIIDFGHLRNPSGQITQQAWTRKFLTVDYAASLQHQFSSSLASTLSFGGQLFQDAVEQTTATASNFPGPGQPTLETGSLRSVTDDERQRVINAGLFLQEQLGWRDRAFITAGVRIDGNSSFGKDFGLQAYPKIGVSYILSDHEFWPVDLVETMKLRAAIGESGKAPGAFDAARTWSPIGQEGQSGFTPNQLGNANLGPERTRELEVGFEASALKGRVALDFTYYNARTLDALVQVRYPPSQGFLDRQLENVGELGASGVEALLTADVLRMDRLDWQARVSWTTIHSKAINLGDQPEIAIGDRTSVRVNMPVPSFFGRKIQNPNALADPIIVEDQFLGATFPWRIVGVGSTLTLLRRLTLDAQGEFQIGGANINYIGYQNALRGVWKACIPVQRKLVAASQGDATALNDVTARERARCAIDRTVQNSEYWIEPTDFFKLRYFSLTYDLPANLLPGAQTASVTFAGRNLLSITDYSGLDPESADLADNTFARREYYQLPQLRSFTLSLRMRL